MKKVLLKEYSNLEQLNLPFKKEEYVIDYHFVDGPFVEIKGSESKEFLIKMTNQDNGEVLYETVINNNMWTRCNKKYFINWKIEIFDNATSELIKEIKFNPKGKRVYIHLDSKALGDTLAWFPYVEEFKKKYDCKVITSTFHNDWFKTKYPDLQFIEPGETAYSLYAKYSIGWHYSKDNIPDVDKHALDFRKLGLQTTSSDTLGLPPREIKPRLTFPKLSPPVSGKYVCIAPHASAHSKYWNYGGGWAGPTGWQTVIDYLNSEGYKVIMITKEPLGDEWHDSKIGGTLQGVIDKTGDYDLADRASDLMNADLFIGLGSGLSWLSWALDTPTVLISGFSKPYSEFKDCTRVFTPSLDICNGCFNSERLDPGDWEWCPKHKNTERQFECTKSITPQMVIDAIKTELSRKN